MLKACNTVVEKWWVVIRDCLTRGNYVSGLHSPHEGLAGGSGQSMSGLAYYQPEHPSAGVVKYPENGHDTLSDFVTFVCQEAENTQQIPQVPPTNSFDPDKFAFTFDVFSSCS